MTKHQINTPVYVTSVGFKKNMAAYPRRMEYMGVSYEFIDAGVRCLIRTGEMVSEILTMSDGAALYRLRSDNKGASWTLLSIIV